MIRLQRQTSFGGKDDLDPGNCWSTCVAMLLGVDAREVPHFCALHPTDDGAWFRATQAWLLPRGVMFMSFNVDPVGWGDAFSHAVSIASGPAVRGHDHSVLWQSGRLLHDPHPSDAGLVEAREFEVLVIIDPSAYAAHVLSGETRAA